ncbi:MAG: hypothetical protein SO484_02795 [Bacilli bacterium]|nr:hypothetical protein [Mycoplasma sp.]MDY4618915.1 hypothetical protein [Bacilli bacterium]
MKKVLKIIGIILISIYSIMAIALTICLLNYNKFKITVLNDKSLIIVKDNELEPTYKKGDLIIVTKNPNKDVKKGDKVFFYMQEDDEITINIGNIVDKQNINANEATYTMNGDYSISSEYFIGKTDTSKVYHNVGSVLNVLESRIGFLFIIIFPILIFFIYEIFIVIQEIKKPDEE